MTIHDVEAGERTHWARTLLPEHEVLTSHSRHPAPPPMFREGPCPKGMMPRMIEQDTTPLSSGLTIDVHLHTRVHVYKHTHIPTPHLKK